MAEHVDKTPDRKSQTAEHKTAQPQGGSGLGFVDKRAVGVMQRKLQEVAENSSQLSQLKALQEVAENSPSVSELRAFLDMTNNSHQTNPSLLHPVQLHRGGKKSKHNRKDRSLAKQSGLYYPLGEGINPRSIERDLEEQDAQQPETKSAGEVVHKILKDNGIEISLNQLLKDFYDLFIHLSSKMQLENNDVLVSIGQSPEIFREFIRHTKPEVKIVNIQISGVSEYFQAAKDNPLNGYKDPIEQIIGDFEGNENFDEEFQSPAGKYLDLIYKNSQLEKNKPNNWWVIDYSNTGGTLEFFQGWFKKKGKEVKIMKINDKYFENLETNVYLKLLKSKNDGPAQIILTALRLVKTKIEISNMDNSQEPPVEDQRTLQLLEGFASEIAMYGSKN